MKDAEDWIRWDYHEGIFVHYDLETGNLGALGLNGVKKCWIISFYNHIASEVDFI